MKKLLLQCELVTITGMHIGGTDTYSAIGAVDSPVIRDARTGRPIVPGSSLKGKLRFLLACSSTADCQALPEVNRDTEPILRVFGCADPVRAARAQFSDCFVSNFDEMRQVGLTEVKSENAISRTDSTALPRQIERVVPGVKFDVRITYNVADPSQVQEDLQLLAKGMKLLQLDYLGGHGSRGSGRVSFRSFRILDENGSEQDDLTEIFNTVDAYELFPDEAGL